MLSASLMCEAMRQGINSLDFATPLEFVHHNHLVTFLVWTEMGPATLGIIAEDKECRRRPWTRKVPVRGNMQGTNWKEEGTNLSRNVAIFLPCCNSHTSFFNLYISLLLVQRGQKVLPHLFQLIKHNQA